MHSRWRGSAVRTDSAEQFNSESCEDEEQKKEEQTEVADFRQCLYHSIEQSAHRLSHLQQLQNCNHNIQPVLKQKLQTYQITGDADKTV